MSEKTCGYHALDDGVHDACPYCTRIRLAALEAEIDRLRKERRNLLRIARILAVTGSAPESSIGQKAWYNSKNAIEEVSDE